MCISTSLLPLFKARARTRSAAGHSKSKLQQAFTLIEVTVATALGVVAMAVVLMLSYFGNRSFASLTNYADMNQLSRLALDKMSKEIRGARLVTAFATNSVTFQDGSGNSFQYAFDSATKRLVRISGGVTNTYLTGCNSLQFWIYQHTAISNTLDCYVPAYVTNARLVQVTWSCSRKLARSQTSTENVESSKIALRNR